MSQKVVTGVDGREWIVSLKIMWTDKSEGFEHEKEGGRRAGVVVSKGRAPEEPGRHSRDGEAEGK